jgi:hypothetical protein
MRVQTLTVLALGIGCLFAADDEIPQKVQVANTQRMDFPAGGVLHLKNSAGEVSIEAWDRPDIEITTTKSTRLAYVTSDREKLLQEVSIAVERRGDEVVITTSLPHRRKFPPHALWSEVTKLDLDYQIKVPRNAQLIAEHTDGELHVEGLTGDIRVTIHKGTTTLNLPEEETYAIDAKSKLGGVVSDFPGHAQRGQWSFAHTFTHDASASSAHKLYVRVGFGDIIIRKVPKSLTPQ